MTRFRVPLPAERAWAALTAPQAVARCLPGAHLAERDDLEHRAVIEASGLDGIGSGTALVTVTVEAEAGSTRVEIRTERATATPSGVVRAVEQMITGSPDGTGGSPDVPVVVSRASRWPVVPLAVAAGGALAVLALGRLGLARARRSRR